MPDPGTMPKWPDLLPRLRNGTVEFPVHHMRGGTSTGLVLWEPFVPAEPGPREELLRLLMGVPRDGRKPGYKQVNGLGRGTATSNKVFLARVDEEAGTPTLVSTLAQLANDHFGVDWSVNCGNMSSALPLWAHDAGFVGTQGDGRLELAIRNTNTGVLTTARMVAARDSWQEAEIPGVDGSYPAVDLFLHEPAGSKTGLVLPTGSAMETVNGRRVSCVDVAVPMVIVSAADLGLTAHELVAELAANGAFMDELRAIWVEAGLRMKLKRRDGSLMTADDLARSETVPKICIVGAPKGGGNIAVRYFTPQTGHASMAVSGGCCLAAAALIPGSVAAEVARGLGTVGAEEAEFGVAIENPAGILDATVVARTSADGLIVRSAAYRRSAQILIRGHAPLHGASPELVAALMDGR